jgi:hypothetical protein
VCNFDGTFPFGFYGSVGLSNILHVKIPTIAFGRNRSMLAKVGLGKSYGLQIA